MISIGEQQLHYLSVKKLAALLRGMTSENNDDFYCMNCLHSFRIKTNLSRMKMYVKINLFCSVTKPSGDTKMLEFNQYQKSDKAPFIIYT